MLNSKNMAPFFFNVNNLYAKNKDLRKEHIKALIQWTKNQLHLPEINEAQAVIFLYRWQYDLQLAKSAIDTYFTARSHFSDIFLDRNVSNSNFKQSMDISLYTVLPQKSKQGYSVLFGKILIPDPNRFFFGQLIKIYCSVLSLHLYHTDPSGYIIFFDVKDFTLELIAKTDLALVRKFFYYLQKVAPAKFKQIHLINPQAYMDKYLALLVPFLEEELASQLYVHQNLTDLYEYVGQSSLPKDYGGSEQSLSDLNGEMKQKITKNVELFDWEDGQIVDETMRGNEYIDVIDFMERGSVRNGKFVID